MCKGVIWFKIHVWLFCLDPWSNLPIKIGGYTDIHKRYQNLRHLDPCMGSIWGLWVFPVIKITVVRQVSVLPAMFCGMSVKTNV